MRWALIYKRCHETRHWTQIPFYGQWCWGKFSTFASKAEAETYYRRYQQPSYPAVEFTVFPTDLLRVPGR